MKISKQLKGALRKGLRLVLATDERGVAKVTLWLSRGTAGKLRLKRPARGRVKVGHSKRMLTRGRSTVRVKFNAKTRKALKRVDRVSVFVRVAIEDSSGNRRRVSTRVTLKR